MNGFAILGIIVGIVVVVAAIAFVIYRTMHPKLKEFEKKPSDEEILKEEMDRLLKPVEDEETAKKIADFKDEDDR